MKNVCAIVVTYNRKMMLNNCIESILSSELVPDSIYIIDNASTDGTKEYLFSRYREQIDKGIIKYFCMPENLGGAGGFHEGLKLALESNYQYFWLMDDDAEPEKDALKLLMLEAEKNEKNKCFVSVATDKEKNELSWGTGILLNNKTYIFEFYNDIPDHNILLAPWAPFLGFLIPRVIVENIGLPRKEYFIWGDDVEYSSRIWNAGYEIRYVKQSVIYHPILKKHKIKFMGMQVTLIDAEDWKQYYGMRNDVYTFSRQKKLLTMLRRIIFYFLVWKTKGMNFKTLPFYLKGLYHGLIGRLGRYK